MVEPNGEGADVDEEVLDCPWAAPNTLSGGRVCVAAPAAAPPFPPDAPEVAPKLNLGVGVEDSVVGFALLLVLVPL